MGILNQDAVGPEGAVQLADVNGKITFDTRLRFDPAAGKLLADVTGTVSAVREVGVEHSAEIDLPERSGVAYLTHADAGAYTLADPAEEDDDKVLTIMDLAGHAHTVTNTTGFNAGGEASDVALFDGNKGSSLRLRAHNGVWYVENLTGVTLG